MLIIKSANHIEYVKKTNPEHVRKVDKMTHTPIMPRLHSSYTLSQWREVYSVYINQIIFHIIEELDAKTLKLDDFEYDINKSQLYRDLEEWMYNTSSTKEKSYS